MHYFQQALQSVTESRREKGEWSQVHDKLSITFRTVILVSIATER